MKIQFMLNQNYFLIIYLKFFIYNVTKKGNDSSILNMTYKELMLTNYLDKSMGTIYLRKEERDTDMKKDKKKYENILFYLMIFKKTN